MVIQKYLYIILLSGWRRTSRITTGSLTIGKRLRKWITRSERGG